MDPAFHGPTQLNLRLAILVAGRTPVGLGLPAGT
jgi:hypothetical protein